MSRIDLKKSKKSPAKERSYPFKFYFGVAAIMISVSFPIYFLIQSALKDHFLTSNSQIVKAIVIDEKNFTGHSPVKQQFFLSYQFLIDGRTYKGNTNNSKFYVGDSVLVKYIKSDPSINEIISH